MKDIPHKEQPYIEHHEPLTALDAPSPYMTTAEMARWLRISRVWLEQRRWKGGGPPFVQLSPSLIRYRAVDVVAWLKANRHTSTAEYKSAGPTNTASIQDDSDGVDTDG